MRAQDAVIGIKNDVNVGSFPLVGGKYAVDVVAGTWGTVGLSKVAGDGATLVPVIDDLSANGSVTVDLSPGSYQFVTADGAATVFAGVNRIPSE